MPKGESLLADFVTTLEPEASNPSLSTDQMIALSIAISLQRIAKVLEHGLDVYASTE